MEEDKYIGKGRVVMLRVLLLACFLLFTTHVEATVFPNRPPVPLSYENEQEIVIVETAPERMEEVQRIIRREYPNVRVRFVYQTALSGLSVQGSRRELRSLVKIPGVSRVTPVSVYKADITESVPFIGGARVRGYFDAAGSRLTGNGVRVGVIDTGVDYYHPDLRRSYAGGYDTVDNDHDPMESKTKEPTWHGSHVAGIIAANGKLQGIAPDAKILAYRALGPGGVGSTETVLAAIERAVKDRVDVLNLSLGNDINGPDWPTSVALNRAAKAGIIAVTASGNSGPAIWTIGSPGTAANAIAVGASTPRLRIPYLRIAGKEIRLAKLGGAKEWNLERTYEWIDAGLGKTADMKNVRNKIALVKRGEISFTEKVRNAQRAGAKAIIIYNNMPGSFEGMAKGAAIPAAAMSGRDGAWLRKQTDSLAGTVFHTEQDRLADFSSRGPVTATWGIKPDVVAPGVGITSTVPEGYMALQGTSMAAPHVAGAAALLKQAHPDWTPEQVKAALMNTAKLLYNGKQPYHVYEQGAGRIQLEQALHPPFLIYPSSLSFGLVRSSQGHTVRTITVTLDNQTEQVQKYVFEMPPARPGIQWRLPHTVYVKPHAQQRVMISAELSASSLREGVHEGYLRIQSSGTTVMLPYLFFIEEPDYPRIMGFRFAQGDAPGLYRYEMYLPGGADELGIILYDPATFHYVDYISYRQNVTSGRVREVISVKQSIRGTYKALIFAKKGKKEDIIERTLKFQ